MVVLRCKVSEMGTRNMASLQFCITAPNSVVNLVRGYNKHYSEVYAAAYSGYKVSPDVRPSMNFALEVVSF